MAEELWNIAEILTSLAASTPLYLTLIAGLVVCYWQRTRRPRIARVLAWAIFAELIWDTMGWRICDSWVAWFGFYRSFSFDDVDHVDWMLAYVIGQLPSATISAGIWGSALWAVLMIEDIPTASPETLSEANHG